MANEDPVYLEWLRQQPCCACGGWGPCVPHHRTGGGVGRKNHDHSAMPLHAHCHRQFHDANGHFKGWDRLRRSEWQDTMIAEHRVRYRSGDMAIPF